jgi:hypothetical protein
MLKLVNYRNEEQSTRTFNCALGWCRLGNTPFYGAFDVLLSNLPLNTRKLLCFYKIMCDKIGIINRRTPIKGWLFSFSDHTAYTEPPMMKYALSCRLSANGIQFINDLCNSCLSSWWCYESHHVINWKFFQYIAFWYPVFLWYAIYHI